MTSLQRSRPRLRDLVAGPGLGRYQPGHACAITDVPDVRVGHTTLTEGEGAHAVRTGVTAILLPRDDLVSAPAPAGVHIVNGYGKSLGLVQVAETGQIETPILITNTLCVWRAAEAMVERTLAAKPDLLSLNPVVLECNDGMLSDIRSLPIRKEHVLRALDAASGGLVAEGSVGAGTGMRAFGYKAGIGTASRQLPAGEGGFTVGVLTCANAGGAGQFRLCGLPIGCELKHRHEADDNPGSIIVVVATDAPCDARQLRRIAVRGALGLGRVGLASGHGSGDIVLAFSTQPAATGEKPVNQLVMPERALSSLFQATVEATEEAYINSVLVCTDMTGRDGLFAPAIPIDRVRDVLADAAGLRCLRAT
jgi:D-aminopeptidase